MSGKRWFLGSARWRRRLLWFGAAFATGAAIAALVVLDPGRNSKTAPRSQPQVPRFGATTSPTPPFATTASPAEERAREHAEAAIRPLANAFVTAMITRRSLGRAHALLAPQLQHGSVDDWQLGRHLPVTLVNTSTVDGQTIAYSGRTEVGTIISINTASQSEDELVALRFDKHGTWLIEYVHQGRSSARVDASNYSPPGFLPGSHRETIGTWLILLAGLAALITTVALADYWISRTHLRRGPDVDTA